MPTACSSSRASTGGRSRAAARRSPTGGGRVTELTARPLLAAFYPELAGVRQPLAGEFAARRELLERMAFCTGYAVEMGLLLDVCADAGLDALAQVDLDVRQNRHQSMADLAPMAAAVLAAVTAACAARAAWRDAGAEGEAARAPAARRAARAARRSCLSRGSGVAALVELLQAVDLGRDQRPGAREVVDALLVGLAQGLLVRPVGAVVIGGLTDHLATADR